MSKAYKCDSCEKLFTYGLVTIEGSIIQYSTFSRGVGIDDTSNLKHEHNPRSRKLELCCECAEPIKKFLFSWWWTDE